MEDEVVDLIDLVVSIMIAVVGILSILSSYRLLTHDSFGGFNTLVEKSYLNQQSELNSPAPYDRYDISLVPAVNTGIRPIRLEVWHSDSVGVAPTMRAWWEYPTSDLLTNRYARSGQLLNWFKTPANAAIYPGNRRFRQSIHLNTNGTIRAIVFTTVPWCTTVYQPASSQGNGINDVFYRCTEHDVWMEIDIGTTGYCPAVIGR